MHNFEWTCRTCKSWNVVSNELASQFYTTGRAETACQYCGMPRTLELTNSAPTPRVVVRPKSVTGETEDLPPWKKRTPGRGLTVDGGPRASPPPSNPSPTRESAAQSPKPPPPPPFGASSVGRSGGYVIPPPPAPTSAPPEWASSEQKFADDTGRPSWFNRRSRPVQYVLILVPVFVCGIGLIAVTNPPGPPPPSAPDRRSSADRPSADDRPTDGVSPVSKNMGPPSTERQP